MTCLDGIITKYANHADTAELLTQKLFSFQFLASNSSEFKQFNEVYVTLHLCSTFPRYLGMSLYV